MMSVEDSNVDKPGSTERPTAKTRKWYSHWREDYKAAIWDEIKLPSCRRIMEIGGTTHRSTGTDIVPDHVESFTIGDISEKELENVPKDIFDVLLFDACGDVSDIDGQFDLIFSKFCGEHMVDGKQFHQNMYDLLAPGGVAIHVIPTLFASPFVVNFLMPEAVSRFFLKLVQPERLSESRLEATAGKFPAYYSLCRGSQKYMERKLADVGFSEIEVRSYFGHSYYDKIPVLRWVENTFSQKCADWRWDFYSSYAIIITRK